MISVPSKLRLFGATLKLIPEVDSGCDCLEAQDGQFPLKTHPVQRMGVKDKLVWTHEKPPLGDTTLTLWNHATLL